ncbi:EamA family transporter [Pseudobdellovibrio exovorus]|uniref:EamA domain-containing protein n=1 Tax=Pseudobdellovibrio exovorus JSS TaxID=1184267 RepID=M4V9X8_9BACT|nr:hypothetical protein A11Q_1777 [Pseudobdellovibrio exovorus JSS]
MASIQSGASLAKSLFYILTPQGVTALRLLFSSLLLLLVWRPWRYTLDRSIWKSIFLYGASLGGMNLLFYMALQRIPLGVAVALEFTGPLLVALLASRHLRDLLWVGLAILGILLLLPLGLIDGANLDPVGITYALLAGACWALYIIFGQRTGSSVPSGVITAWGMLVAAIAVVPFGVFVAHKELFNLDVWPIAFGVAVLSSALPYSLEMVALKRLPAKTFSILMSLEPALAALSGLLFLNEKLNFTQLLAIALLIIASVGTTLTSRYDEARGG